MTRHPSPRRTGTKRSSESSQWCAILSINGPNMTTTTTLDLVTNFKMMTVVGVHVRLSEQLEDDSCWHSDFSVPQSTPPNETLAIPINLGCEDPVCCFGESLT